MKTIVDALKELQAKLGGSASSADDVQTISQAIDEITKVAGSGGGGGSDLFFLIETVMSPGAQAPALADPTKVNEYKASLADGKIPITVMRASHGEDSGVMYMQCANDAIMEGVHECLFIDMGLQNEWYYNVDNGTFRQRLS